MNLLKQALYVGLIVLMVILPYVHAENKSDENFCHDPQSWAEWDELVRKYPDDTSLQMLHALRIGLCHKIEDGTISFEKASMIFNKLHDQAIEDTKKEHELRKENETL